MLASQLPSWVKTTLSDSKAHNISFSRINDYFCHDKTLKFLMKSNTLILVRLAILLWEPIFSLTLNNVSSIYNSSKYLTVCYNSLSKIPFQSHCFCFMFVYLILTSLSSFFFFLPFLFFMSTLQYWRKKRKGTLVYMRCKCFCFKSQALYLLKCGPMFIHTLWHLKQFQLHFDKYLMGEMVKKDLPHGNRGKLVSACICAHCTWFQV